MDNLKDIKKQLDKLNLEFIETKRKVSNLMSNYNHDQQEKVKESQSMLDNQLKEEKKKRDKLFSEWTKYANTKDYSLMEENYFKSKELDRIKNECLFLEKLVNEEFLDDKFKYSREYLNYFNQNKGKNNLFQLLSVVADPLLGFFRNTTPIIFLTVAARYFYSIFPESFSKLVSYDVSIITVMEVVGFFSCGLCLIASLILNCLSLLNSVSEKLKIESGELEKFRLLIICPAALAFLTSTIIIWKKAGTYFNL